jgi:activator of HSP90 ATPase
MAEKIKIKDIIPASPAEIYGAWLNSKKHAAMTGAGATASARAGGKFTAWDGYISGKNIKFEKDKKIVQAWRTTGFPNNEPDSKLEVVLKKIRGGTEVTFIHTGIPDGQGKSYKKGWIDFYFKPMKKYFKGKK